MPGDREQMVYNGWLKITKREIEGKVYDILNDYHAVAAIITNEFHELLVVKQYRPALKTDTLEIPAGVLDDPKEKITDCLVREVWEEAHVEVKPDSMKHYISYLPNVGFSSSKLHLFTSCIRKEEFQSRAVYDSDVREAFWISFEDLETKVETSEIEDVKTIIAYLYLKTRLES